MDKRSITSLEGVGYVASIVVGVGGILGKDVVGISWLPWLGLMVLGIALVRLAAASACASATEKAAEAEPQAEKKA